MNNDSNTCFITRDSDGAKGERDVPLSFAIHIRDAGLYLLGKEMERGNRIKTRYFFWAIVWGLISYWLGRVVR